MMIRLPLWCLISASLLTACANLPSTASKNNQSVAERDGLPAQTLLAGECGLFVWTSGPAREFILFSSAAKREAIWESDAGEQILSISEQSGTPTQGQFPNQSYGPVDLTLELRSAQPIEYGTRYKGGTLTLKSEGQWDKVIPIVGLTACQPSG